MPAWLKKIFDSGHRIPELHTSLQYDVHGWVSISRLDAFLGKELKFGYAVDIRGKERVIYYTNKPAKKQEKMLFRRLKELRKEDPEFVTKFFKENKELNRDDPFGERSAFAELKFRAREMIAEVTNMERIRKCQNDYFRAFIRRKPKRITNGSDEPAWSAAVAQLLLLLSGECVLVVQSESSGVKKTTAVDCTKLDLSGVIALIALLHLVAEINDVVQIFVVHGTKAKTVPALCDKQSLDRKSEVFSTPVDTYVSSVKKEKARIIDVGPITYTSTFTLNIDTNDTTPAVNHDHDENFVSAINVKIEKSVELPISVANEVAPMPVVAGTQFHGLDIQPILKAFSESSLGGQESFIVDTPMLSGRINVDIATTGFAVYGMLASRYATMSINCLIPRIDRMCYLDVVRCQTLAVTPAIEAPALASVTTPRKLTQTARNVVVLNYTMTKPNVDDASKKELRKPAEIELLSSDKVEILRTKKKKKGVKAKWSAFKSRVSRLFRRGSKHC